MQITHTRVTTGHDNQYGDKPFTVEHVMTAEVPLKDLKKFVTKFTKMIKEEQKRSEDRGDCITSRLKDREAFDNRFARVME
ncbi:MAG: hypothetical protein BWY95_00657 [Bacteroidetes bacterium ADurb.BinA104]|jgi:hypothetical protein|nr:MAG: hypothetical protein BWY95_00657 [Bacteroidetes bacterium ADurb.BinA104]